jgi:hypothetical protein
LDNIIGLANGTEDRLVTHMRLAKKLSHPESRMRGKYIAKTWHVWWADIHEVSFLYLSEILVLIFFILLVLAKQTVVLCVAFTGGHTVSCPVSRYA